MIFLYLNYPNGSATVHRNAQCLNIRAAKKQGQRAAKINSLTLPLELRRFKNKVYTFSADTSKNDFWLEIDLRDSVIELAVAKRILQLAGRHYTPFRGLEIRIHC